MVRVYRVPVPDDAHFGDHRKFGSEELFRPGRKRAKPDSAIAFRKQPGWFIVKARLAAGRYRLSLVGEIPGPAAVAVLDSTNYEVARLPLAADGSAEFSLPNDDRYHFQIMAPQGSWFQEVELASTASIAE